MKAKLLDLISLKKGGENKNMENGNHMQNESHASAIFSDEVVSYLKSRSEDTESQEQIAKHGLEILQKISGNHLSYMATQEGHLLSYLIGFAFSNASKLAERYDMQRSSTP